MILTTEFLGATVHSLKVEMKCPCPMWVPSSSCIRHVPSNCGPERVSAPSSQRLERPVRHQ